MINISKAELHLYVDSEGKSVPPWTPNATWVVTRPGEEITPILSAEEIALLKRTGHIDPTA